MTEKTIATYTERFNPFDNNVENIVIREEGNPAPYVQAITTVKNHSSFNGTDSVLSAEEAHRLYDFRKVNNLRVVGNLYPEVVCIDDIDFAKDTKFYEAWTDGRSYIIFDAHNDLSKTKPGPERAILFGDQVRAYQKHINNLVN